MIYTERKVSIKNDKATIDSPIILFRGDREVEIMFTIVDSKFKFESNKGNVIDKTQAAFGQLAVALPDGTDLFTEIVACINGVVVFSITGEMIDEIHEVGFYSFHIRLYNDDKSSRITLPPVMEGIEIREPLIIEGDVENTDLVGDATVGYSMVQTVGTDEEVFDEDGNYIPTVWGIGDKITAEKLNKAEEGISVVSSELNTMDTIVDLTIVIDNMYSISPMIKNAYHNSVETADTSYSYFKVNVNKGETYHMYPRIRILEQYNDGVRVYHNDSNVDSGNMVSYTPETDGILYVTVYNTDLHFIKMSTNENMDEVSYFDEGLKISDNVCISEHKDVKTLAENFAFKNLFNVGQYTPGFSYKKNGFIVAEPQYGYVIIPVESDTTYTLEPRARMVSFYNDSQHISFDESFNGAKCPKITTPEGATCMMLTVYTSDVDDNKIYIYKSSGDPNYIEKNNQTILSDDVRLFNHPDIKAIESNMVSLDEFVINNNLLTDAPRVDGYYHLGTSITEESKYCYYEVNLKAGVTYYMYPRIRVLTLYTMDGRFISSDNENCNTDAQYAFTPEYDVIAFVSYYIRDENHSISIESDNEMVLSVGEKILQPDITIQGNGVIKRQEINNLLYNAPRVDGYYHLGTSIQEAGQYCYYEVNLKAGVTYYMYPRIRVLTLYTMDGRFISSDNKKCNTNAQYAFTPEQDVIAFVSYYIKDENHSISIESDPRLVINESRMILNPDIKVTLDDSVYAGNILYKKKWAVIGDSFTAGDFNGYTDENGLTGKNSPDLYDSEIGMFKTYPWWIMKRNNMTIQKFYMGGRTLATPADGTFTNSITYNDMYKQIDADVDYITIRLGVNDGHHMPGTTGDDGEDTTGAIPIGTETDETTATFYGAWNVLLRDLITLYPFAHIGILVSNGMDTDEHVNATIKMAKKWGIPYLNLDSGYDVPLLIRSRPNCRPETCAEAIEIRRSQQRVSNSNVHPNHLTHKYESTFIEAFLRRI